MNNGIWLLDVIRTSETEQQHLDKILMLEKIAMPYNSLLICDFPLYLSGLFSQIQSFAL